MLKITERIQYQQQPQHTLTLPFEVRQKGRFKSQLDDGTEVGVFLDRGVVLRDGDLLQAEDGSVVCVHAAAEDVSTVRCQDPVLLARLCYHLGNRHVPLQIGENMVRYQHDHVLDDMVQSLGLRPVSESAPFEPEAGAYHQHAHSAAHNHTH